jgi:hypothetical protein
MTACIERTPCVYRAHTLRPHVGERHRRAAVAAARHCRAHSDLGEDLDLPHSTLSGWSQFTFLGTALLKIVRMSDPIFECAAALRESRDYHVHTFSIVFSVFVNNTFADEKFVRTHLLDPNSLQCDTNCEQAHL